MPEIPKNIEQKDLVKYLTTVVALVKKLKNATRLELEEITNKIDKLKIKKGDKGEDGRDGKDGRDGLDGERGHRGSDGVNGSNGVDGKDGYTPIPGIDYEIPEDGKDGIDGKDGSQDTPEEVKNKLETLRDDDRLPIKAIKDLRKELDELRRMAINSQIVGGGVSGGSSGGNIVKAYDLSAQLDGATKVFTLPSMWRIISVHLSSVPNILRDTTDYVYDGTANTITFTAEITASSSLATGQTCIITYAV